MSDRRSAAQHIFISHSWRDKPLARRIARRLAHRGATIWIDETEMQVGDRLPERLAAEIRRSSHFVVLLTTAAVASRWVAQEIEIAKGATEPRIALLPLIAESGVSSSLLDESLGVEIADPLAFEDKLDIVAAATLGTREPVARDAAVLRRDLEDILREAPELRDLIVPLASEGRITHAQPGAVKLTEQQRHPAETGLIALYEFADATARNVISLVAVRCYRQLGVGYEVLRRQIDLASEDNLSTLSNHLGDKILRAEDLDGAFSLFQQASPRQDQGFNNFVKRQFRQLHCDPEGQGRSLCRGTGPRSVRIHRRCRVQPVFSHAR
jgi:hypothetical protein